MAPNFLKTANQFLRELYQEKGATENGAISNSTTQSALLDYFSKSGTYRERSFAEVSMDMKRIWTESPEMALRTIFYNRLITRQVHGFVTTEKVQKGQGNRSEFRACIAWLAQNHDEVLYKNLWLVPVVGSWKDLWHPDLLKVLNRSNVYSLVKQGIENGANYDLLAKYLPKYRSKSNTYNPRHEALNDFVRGLQKFLGWNPVQYRKFKSSGNAHEFQRKMCANKWTALNYNSIPGKALFQLVNHKGKDRKTTIERHCIGYEYAQWIENQPTAKFTGYVYELMKAISPRMSYVQQVTIDKQFDGLIELAEKDGQVTENVWCAVDTSGSMMAPVANTTAYNICISLGVYFSTLNKGAFKDHVVMFDNQSRLMQLSGTFTNKVQQIMRANTAWGSTDFQSVIDTMVNVRKLQPNIPKSDFPSTVIVVSDMQFNPVYGNARTNYEEAMRKLRRVGLPEIRIVWWWITGRAADFPSEMNDEGVVMIGGFDGAIISNILGNKAIKGKEDRSIRRTPYEAMKNVLNQEVLSHLHI